MLESRKRRDLKWKKLGATVRKFDAEKHFRTEKIQEMKEQQPSENINLFSLFQSRACSNVVKVCFSFLKEFKREIRGFWCKE